MILHSSKVVGSQPILTFILLLFSFSICASEEDEMAAMQRQLNANVMAQSFNPGDLAKIDAYVKQAMKKDLQPEPAPNYWRPGYTCDYIRYHRYVYSHYRNCLYHYRYRGYYWGHRPVVVAPQPVIVAPAPKVVVATAPAVNVRTSSKTIHIEEFDEDALEDYYKGLKSAVKFMSMFSSFTPEQFEQVKNQNMGGQWWLAWSGIVTGQLETAKIELESWPLSARKEGWKILGKRIKKYNTLFNKHRNTIIANEQFEAKLKNSIKSFDLVTETSILET